MVINTVTHLPTAIDLVIIRLPLTITLPLFPATITMSTPLSLMDKIPISPGASPTTPSRPTLTMTSNTSVQPMLMTITGQRTTMIGAQLMLMSTVRLLLRKNQKAIR